MHWINLKNGIDIMYRVYMHGVYGIHEPELVMYRVYRHGVYGIHGIKINLSRTYN